MRLRDHLQLFQTCQLQGARQPPAVPQQANPLHFVGEQAATGQVRTPVGQERVTCSPFCPWGWCLFLGERGWEGSLHRYLVPGLERDSVSAPKGCGEERANGCMDHSHTWAVCCRTYKMHGWRQGQLTLPVGNFREEGSTEQSLR